MNYLNVKENHLCNIFSSDSGRKDLQTVVCACVQIFTQIKKGRGKVKKMDVKRKQY